MIFFINATMPKQKSGIEHAQLKRMALFNLYKTDVRLILRDWDPVAHINTNLAGVSDKQLINMFDYFQGATEVEAKHLQATDLQFGQPNLQFQEDAEHNRYLVTNQLGRLIARVNYDSTDARRVRSTELFDVFNNLYRVNHYDSRGFLSLAQWYTPDNKVGTETWLTPDGRTVLETFNKQNARGELKKSGWRLTDQQGKIHIFDTIDELTLYFYDCLNDDFWSAQTPNIFVLDRAHLGDWALLHLKKPAYTVLHLHNSQVSDAQDPANSVVNNHYEFGLANKDQYDAIISATHRQQADVKQRFAPKAELFTIPVGIVDPALLAATPVPVAQRTFGKMVVFARIAWEKNLVDLVKAVTLVHKEIPAVTLDIYGYADPSNDYQARRAIEAVIVEEHLENVVTLKGYTTDVGAVENDAMMYGLTSKMEGFNLAILEAISHGLISFTYDVNYGPNEIVQDGVNGAIVPYGDYQALASKMIDVLKNPQLAQAYSDGAYASAERYSSETVWQAWQKLLASAQAEWSQRIITTTPAES